jgi:hypothetical protein
MSQIYELISNIALLVSVASIAGCAIPLGTRTVDVTHDPDFQSAYRESQVYRLRTDEYLVQVRTDEADRQLVLWPFSPAESAHNQNPPGSSWVQLARTPAGSTIRVNCLRYYYLNYFPPWPGGGSVISEAYGTLTTPSAQWQNVMLPNGSDTDGRAHNHGVWRFFPIRKTLKRFTEIVWPRIRQTGEDIPDGSGFTVITDRCAMNVK